jgi:hypothetical protein
VKIVSPCLARDLSVYRLAYQSLLQHLPDARPHVITSRADFPKFRDACGTGLILMDQDEMISGMTIANLRDYPLPFFPAGAGWYYQQLLKWGFSSHCDLDEGYLIWDADTILLRPLEFKDNQGRIFLTTSSEYHEPYFETYEALLGHRPNDRISFISQHQWIEVKLLRELLGVISGTDGRNWPWEIMAKLRGDGTNLFSEYETYGHYCLTRHPEACALRQLPWSRDGRSLAGFPPRSIKLPSLSDRFAFVSFESNRSFRGWCVHRLRKILHWY